jgi:hypothetical protein
VDEEIAEITVECKDEEDSPDPSLLRRKNIWCKVKHGLWLTSIY